jgi:halimadienyl-diphosphate synthase
MRLEAAAPVAARSRVQPAVPIRALVCELVAEIAADEDERWGGGQISASAYETAWVALVRHPEDADRLAFPASRDWLLRHQRRDGSWGPPFPHSLIPTLAALLALRHSPDQDVVIERASLRAQRYLRRVLPRWHADLVDTPFFEFLVPWLAEDLERTGIHLGIPDMALMAARREAKLARLPLETLYAGGSSLVHALEVFGPRLDFRRVQTLRAPNGGYGHSPSATASVLLHAPDWDAAAARWLHRLEQHAEDTMDPGAMPTSHPADTFEAAWALHLLWQAGLAPDPAADDATRRLLRWLRRCLTPTGATFSRVRGLPCDADDTALVLAVLNEYGVRTDLATLRPFERERCFVSYDGERTASTSTNAHVLDALLSVPAIGLPAPAAQRHKLVRYLLSERSTEGYWIDKWHLSPYYATLSCALALARMPDDSPRPLRALDETLAWLGSTQRRGGGWGIAGPTLEETAYGALTVAGLLRLMPRLCTDERRRMVRRARSYLRRHLGILDAPASLPTLWVDKTLYAPPRVLRAAVLAALYDIHNDRPSLP